ncbi:transcriptional regulator [[Bacillus thuringiensis] serovar konkukian]|nr:helix-turn-helix transcriptional regulator [Bacillus thuringiensis]MED1302648.1 helix-turn-helix transcriptional regulator [Bacillus pacificus]OUB04481.1 transcriptional regulator [[Bacillus thuringiensis] serovar konkukian]
MSQLSKRLVELRKKQGYTQNDVSYHLNIARTTYANWEYGKADPDVDSIIRIANLYNISTDALFGRKTPIENHLELIKVSLADLPIEEQHKAIDILIDYTSFIKKHFVK